MRRAFLFAALLVALLLSPPAQAQDPAFTVFGNYLESLGTQLGIPGMVAAVVGTQGVLWQRAYGQQDNERKIATRADTPFHVDGLTQVFTASMILRCVEEGRLSLDDRIGKYQADSPDAGLTIAQVLTHTAGSTANPVFSYSLARVDSLAYVLSACSGESSREMLSKLLAQNSMIDSVPGADTVDLTPPYEGVTASAIERYSGVLKRLAVPYAVDAALHATPSRYVYTALKPSTGLVTTAIDFAQFDLALKRGILLKPETLAAAWRPPVDASGRTLPHGYGWFVQAYNGKPIAWQFGLGDSASSSLMVTIPSQGLTLVLVANSDGLVKPFNLTAGDVTSSPFARVFLSTFAR